MQPYLWIALGSALGGCARYALGSAILAAAGSNPVGFPWGTFAVNIAGCFAIGVFASTLQSAIWRELLIIGLCGGFTTFSSFGLETLHLLRNGEVGLAFAYVAGSVVLCLAAVWMGHSIASRFLG